MKTSLIRPLLAGMLIVGLAACDDDLGLGPETGTGDTEAQLAVDSDLTDVIVTDAEAAIDALSAVQPSVGTDIGVPQLSVTDVPDDVDVEAARELLRQARETFAEARRAWQAGDTELAAELAMEARLLVAEAMVLVFGEDAYTRYLERVDNLIAWLEERVDGGTSDLLERIRELREEAVVLFESGDLIPATERLILAVQIAHRERIHQRRDRIDRHARLSIFMANSAVELATEIVGDDATDRQAGLLRHAVHTLSHAEQAFQNGRLRVAFGLARETVNLSLVAALLEPDTDVSKVRMMIELSDRAIAAAEEAVADLDPTSLEARLVEHANALQDRGLEIAETRPRRAIRVLWHASVTAFGVVRLVG